MMSHLKSVMGEDKIAHYNIFGCEDPEKGMEILRKMFPNPDELDKMNLVLFSTSGIHGSYKTIESAEKELNDGEKPGVTFLVVHPRMVCLKYGICEPKNQNDIDYLKELRKKSHEVISKIGYS